MLDHLDWLRWRQFNHLAVVIQALARESIRTLWTAHQCMPFDPRRDHPFARRVVLRSPLPPRLATRRFLALRFYKPRRIPALVDVRLQLDDPFCRNRQLLLHLAQQPAQFRILGPQAFMHINNLTE
jgi:hypothetical protein